MTDSNWLKTLSSIAHKIAIEKGFTDATPGEDFALIHSEVSEALEAYREGMGLNDHLYENIATGEIATGRTTPSPLQWKPVGVPSELADVLIRVFHFAGKHNIDLDQAVAEKLAYNSTRPHKHGGKKL
jgi:NTP pyrophosphatase (non-canonical NTP hydrolase)